MAGQELHDRGTHARAAYNTPQSINVYQDLTPEVAQRVMSIEARFGRRSISGIDGHTDSPHSSSTGTPPTALKSILPELENTANGLSSPIPDLSFTSQDLFTPLETRNRVLQNNPLKVNSTPQSPPHRTLDETLKNGPGPGQKRRKDSFDENPLPPKSPKLRHPRGRVQGLRVAPPKHEPAILGPHGEPPPSGIPAKPSNFKEDSMNSRAGKGRKPSMSVAAANPDDMDIDMETPRQPAYSNFDGLPTTPRPHTMYTFGSHIRNLNPIKAVGKFFGRASHETTPIKSKKDDRIAQEVARQVESQMQQFEDQLYDKFVARQAAETVKTRSASVALKQTPELQMSGFEDKDIEMSEASSISSAVEMKVIESSSPVLPPARMEHPPRQSSRPQVTFDDQPTRTRFGNIMRSPTKIGSALRASKPSRGVGPASSGMFRDSTTSHQSRSSLEFSDIASPLKDGPSNYHGTQQTTPRLKHKASQHLAKMASKINLRGSKRSDVLGASNDEYKILKKKNKDEIVKDYLSLQREKQELERKLASGLYLHEQKPAPASKLEPVVAPQAPTPEAQIARDMNPVPVLKTSTTPDFSILHENKPLPAAPSPGKSSTETTPPQAPAHQEITSRKASDTSAGSTTPPVPTVPTKYKSKVPKAVRNLRSNGSGAGSGKEAWKGWDDDIF